MKSIQLGVGAIVFKDDSVLLIKRKNPPNQNQWAIPGGRVNYGEPLKDAVERELLEETGVVVQALEPVFSFDVIESSDADGVVLHYVIIDFSAEYVSGTPRASDDALDACWVSRSRYPELQVNKTTEKLLKEMFNFP